MEEDTEMQEIMNKTPNFEEQENGSHSRKHCMNCSQCCMMLLIVSLVLPVLTILGSVLGVGYLFLDFLYSDQGF